MQSRIAAFAILAVESVKYLIAEIRAGHIGRFGHHAYEFYANELLAARYSGFRKAVVASFVLFAALKEQNDGALRIVLQEDEGKAAVTKLRDQKLLKGLQEWALANGRMDVATLATSRIKEMRTAKIP